MAKSVIAKFFNKQNNRREREEKIEVEGIGEVEWGGGSVEGRESQRSKGEVKGK